MPKRKIYKDTYVDLLISEESINRLVTVDLLLHLSISPLVIMI